MENITPTEAVKRLTWRFGQNKTFTPNENDINAINTLVDHFNNENKQANHLLFAKLLLLTYHDYLPKFGEEKTLEKINKILSEDIGFILERLRTRLNCFDLDIYFKSKGIVDASIYECNTIDEIKLKQAKNKEKLKSINLNEFKEVVEGYDLEEISFNMNGLINHYLKIHK